MADFEEAGRPHTIQIGRNSKRGWPPFSAVVSTAFHIIVERDEEGLYVGSVPELPGCHSQARTKNELRTRILEAIQAYLSAGKPHSPGPEFVEVQTIEV